MTFVWTPPRTFVATEVETDVFFNTHLQANMWALTSGVHAYNTSYYNPMTGASSAPWPSAGTYAIAFDGITGSDPYGMFSAGAPTRITCPVAGWYKFRGAISGFASGGYTPKLYKSGVVAVNGLPATTGPSSVGEYDVQVVAGDYLELRVTIASGSGSVAPSSVQGSTVYVGDPEVVVVADLSVKWVSP